MITRILKLNNTNFDEITTKAAEFIKEGKIVIFPTETVYGIGANALDDSAVQKIYKAKGRPSDNPLIVHIDDYTMLEKVSKNIDERTKKIIDYFWPGPLTIIVEKSDIITNSITGNLPTVAVRMPSNFIARAIIEKSNLPIAAPSANISGKPSITSENFVCEEFMGKVDLIILNSSSEIGIESTVVDTTSEKISILRPGFITKNDLETILNEEVVIDLSLINDEDSPKSPGMKYKHYAPKCELFLFSGEIEEQKSKIKEKIQEDVNSKVKSVVLGKNLYKEDFTNLMSLGDNSKDVAKNIFTVLRILDELEIEKAYFIYEVENELDFSIMDRVKKASGYKII